MGDDLVKRLRFYTTGESPGSWRIANLNEAADRIEALEAALASARAETVEECAQVAEERALWSPATMRNAGGEMTSQEIRTAKAFMRSIAEAIRVLPAPPSSAKGDG